VTIAPPRTTPSGDDSAVLSSGELRGLTGLRIVAAVWVVLFHFHFTPLPGVAEVVGVLGPLITSGALGVDLFFVLSGFVIAYTYLDQLGPRLRAGHAARFVWARASRLWPVYALVLHLFGLWLVARTVFGSDTDIAFQAVQPVVNSGEWLQQFFMVQLWGHAFFDGASWVGATWSISAEWLAYLLFPVAALVFFRLRNLPVVVLAAASLALMAPVAWAYLALGHPYYPWSWLVRILCGFGGGVFAYLVVRRLRATDGQRRIASGLAVAVPVLIAAGLWFGELLGPGRGGAGIVLFPVLIAALALADRGPAARVLSSRPAVYGGRISYALYLVHIPLFEVYWLALLRFPELGPDTGLAHLAGLTAILASVVVAVVAHHAVEEPARRRMRRMVPAASPAARGREDAIRPIPEAVPAFEPPAPLPAAGRPALRVALARRQCTAAPRHAASPTRRPTLADVLANAQRRHPSHRVGDLERAAFLRSAYLSTGS
jgi:peptidoglycan/LPS O-acetylase OafA/YrhL